jgi:hypothetical protein
MAASKYSAVTGGGGCCTIRVRVTSPFRGDTLPTAGLPPVGPSLRRAPRPLSRGSGDTFDAPP